MTRERSASCWFLTQERVLYVATKKQRAARAMHACAAAATTARAPPSFKHRPRIAVCKGPRRAALLDTTRAFLAPRTHRYGQYFLIPPSLPPSLPLSLSLSLSPSLAHSHNNHSHTHTRTVTAHTQKVVFYLESHSTALGHWPSSVDEYLLFWRLGSGRPSTRARMPSRESESAS